MSEPWIRSIPDWEGTVATLKETLEEVLQGLERAQADGVRSDIQALEAFDALDRYLAGIKQDLGV